MPLTTDRTPAFVPAQPAPASGVLRVLGIDAVPLVSYGLRALVDQTGGLAWCGAMTSTETAVRTVGHVRPHVVLVDSALDPELAGVRALITAQSGPAVIVLVRRDQPNLAGYLRAARAIRVAGLVARTAVPDVIIAAVRAARSGRCFVDPGLAPVFASDGDHGDQGDPVRLPQAVVLSARQREILQLIAHGRRNAEIADLLVVSVETVRTHVKQVLRRLQAQDRAHAVARAYELGLLRRAAYA